MIAPSLTWILLNSFLTVFLTLQLLPSFQPSWPFWMSELLVSVPVSTSSMSPVAVRTSLKLRCLVQRLFCGLSTSTSLASLPSSSTARLNFISSSYIMFSYFWTCKHASFLVQMSLLSSFNFFPVVFTLKTSTDFLTQSTSSTPGKKEYSLVFSVGYVYTPSRYSSRPCCRDLKCLYSHCCFCLVYRLEVIKLLMNICCIIFKYLGLTKSSFFFLNKLFGQPNSMFL